MYNDICRNCRTLGRFRFFGIWGKEPSFTSRNPSGIDWFTLLAIGTSLPELAASISLTKKGEFGMLLGNIVGSNMFNIGLVGGVVGVLGPITVSTHYPWIDYLSLLLLTGILAYWLMGKQLKKSNGIQLLIIYLIASIVTWTYNS